MVGRQAKTELIADMSDIGNIAIFENGSGDGTGKKDRDEEDSVEEMKTARRMSSMSVLC